MSRENRNDEIEVLRAVAILLVVVSHLNFLFAWYSFEWLNWISTRFTFWTGVDLFFCISGFVIARSLVPKLGAQDGGQFWEEVIAFWIRRWYRLIPSAWVWVAIVLLLTLFLNKNYLFGHFQKNVTYALSAILNIANFYSFECIKQDATSCGSPIGIYWSLSLEEQFYVALPILIALAGRRLAALCLFLVLLQLFVDRHPSNSLLWFVRTDAIFLGVLLALTFNSRTYAAFEPRVLAQWAPRWFVFILLCYSLGAVPAVGMVSFSTGYVALVSVALVFVASHDKGYLMADGWLRKILVWIGSRSYAIYLIHWPIFLLTSELWIRMEPGGEPISDVLGIAFHVGGLVMVFVLSELNYRLLETPYREKGRFVARRYLERAAASRASS